MAVETGFGLPQPGGGGAGRQTFVPADSPFADVAALETWAAANPNDLRNGTGDNNIVTVLVVTDNTGLSDTSSITYEWSGEEDEPDSYTPVADRGFWIVHTALDAAEVKSLNESNPNTNAFEDADSVTVTSIQSLPVRSIPVATASGFESSVMAQMSDDSVMVAEALRVQGNSGVRLGPGVPMFDQGTQPGYKSEATGNTYTFMLNQYLRQTGFIDPVFSRPVSDDAEPDTFDFQLDDSVTLTNPSFALPNTDTRLLDDLMFRAPAGVTNSNVCLRLRSVNNSNADVLYIPNERDWMQVVAGDFSRNPGHTFTGVADTDSMIDVFESKVQTISPSFSNVTYQVDFVANGDVVLLGEAGGIPYLRGRGHAFEFKSLTEHINDLISEIDAGGVNLNLEGVLEDDVGAYLAKVRDDLLALRNAEGGTSRRGIQRFNTSFSMNDNPALWQDRNNLYTAQLDKVTDVEAPDLATVTDYLSEFTHIAGSGRLDGSGTNLLRIYRHGGDPNLSADIIAILQLNDLIVMRQEGVEWVVTRGTFNPMSTTLPSGVFDLQLGELADVGDLGALGTVDAGFAFIVGTGGGTVEEGDIIVALEDNPGTDVTAETWFVFGDKTARGLTVDEVAFFNHIVRSGARFDADRRFFVNPSNVVVETNTAAGTPLQSPGFFTPNAETEQTHLIGTLPLTFAGLVGGRLTLEYSIAGSSSGFDPEFRDIILDYGNGIVFTFNILGRSTNGLESVTIQAPNVDYSAALNVNCNVSIRYIERGNQFAGNLNLFSLVNVNTGTLHQPILNLIDDEVTDVERTLQSEIDSASSSRAALASRLTAVEALESNPVFGIGDSVVSVLTGATVDEQTTVTRTATQANLILGGGSVAGLIPQTNPAINQAPADRIGRKVFYIPTPETDGMDLLLANDGTTDTLLVERVGSSIVAKQFVPSIPSGSSTQERYPSPSNQIGGAGTWFLMQLEVGHTSPVAASLSFTQSIPMAQVSVTVYTQLLSNGNPYDSTSRTIQAGGADTSISFVESTPDGETVNVTVNYIASSRVIRVQAEPHVNTGRLALDDMQVRMEWSETVTTPGTPATTRDVRIGSAANAITPIGVKIVGANIFLSTRVAEIDTGYVANTVLGGGLSGSYTVPTGSSWDAIFECNVGNMTTLFNISGNQYFGLFTDVLNHESVFELGTQLSCLDDKADAFNVGQSIAEIIQRLDDGGL